MQRMSALDLVRQTELTLVVEGPSLAIALENDASEFVALALNCSAVICCRYGLLRVLVCGTRSPHSLLRWAGRLPHRRRGSSLLCRSRGTVAWRSATAAMTVL